MLEACERLERGLEHLDPRHPRVRRAPVGPGDEGLVDVGPAFIADAQAAELVKPTERSFDDPAHLAKAAAVRLSTLGLVQYLNPTLQVACAVLIMGDAVTPWHGAALALIWVALAIYSVAGWRDDRRAASADSSSVISPTTVK